MRRAKEILGKSIVSADSGERLGAAADLLLDPTRQQIVGIAIRGGWFEAERVLPFAEVKALGRDAIVANSKDGVLDRRQWRERAGEAPRSRDLKGKRVMTAEGRSLGAVNDVLVDEHSGAIEGYEIAGRTGLLARRSVLARDRHVAIGPDAIVVPETAIAVTRHDDGEAGRSGDVPPSPHSLPS